MLEKALQDHSSLPDLELNNLFDEDLITVYELYEADITINIRVMGNPDPISGAEFEVEVEDVTKDFTVTDSAGKPYCSPVLVFISPKTISFLSLKIISISPKAQLKFLATTKWTRNGVICFL